MKGSFNSEKLLIERNACHDKVDGEILQLLVEAGNPGLLPKDLQAKLGKVQGYLASGKQKNSKNEQTLRDRI